MESSISWYFHCYILTIWITLCSKCSQVTPINNPSFQIFNLFVVEYYCSNLASTLAICKGKTVLESP